jgi:hypothetical protein
MARSSADQNPFREFPRLFREFPRLFRKFPRLFREFPCLFLARLCSKNGMFQFTHKYGCKDMPQVAQGL